MRAYASFGTTYSRLFLVKTLTMSDHVTAERVADTTLGSGYVEYTVTPSSSKTHNTRELTAPLLSLRVIKTERTSLKNESKDTGSLLPKFNRGTIVRPR